MSRETVGKETRSGELVVESDSTGAALRITQTGSGDALVVGDSAHPDSTPFAVDQYGQVRIGSAGQPSNTKLATETSSGTPNRLQMLQTGVGSIGVAMPASVGAMALEVNGSERMRIDSSGNVGIGTTTPASRLHAYSSGDGDVEVARLVSDAPPADSFGQTTLSLFKSGTYGGSISGYLHQGVGVGLILSSISGGTHTERMRVTSAGNVGIGTSSPGQRLHVYGSQQVALVESSVSSDASFAAKTTAGQWRVGTGIGVAADVLNIYHDTGTVGEKLRIDNAGLITGTGTSLGAWTAYTPTLGGTGWALGNGTATGYYCQIGKVVHFRFDITFGSTSTFGASAALRVSTPVTARNALLFQQIPVVIAYDVSAGKFYQMSAMVASTTGIDLYAYNGGANGEISELRSTNPFTWASGDIIRLQGSVEAA